VSVQLSLFLLLLLLCAGAAIQNWREKNADQYDRINQFTGHDLTRFVKGE
jgi:hypothetical protein